MRTIIIALACISFSLAAYAKDISIDQKDQKFVPDEVTLKTGDSLVFRNSDIFPHNIVIPINNITCYTP